MKKFKVTLSVSYEVEVPNDATTEEFEAAGMAMELLPASFESVADSIEEVLSVEEVLEKH